MGYVLIGVMILAGIFFSIALYYRAEVRVLKFTAFGFATLGIISYVVVSVEPNTMLKVATVTFIFLSIIFYWFYQGALRDES